ncbi:heat shock 70 kDa protein 12A-like [Mya arenaria]|uniref:heat shock 70 kDa protein 12A-like n=1 Tax=Mya arenaria TaxID=6604 RepID=UPI0022E4994D|nr:heat shock 70 kDa protein 12A-like [Mya arenaria]XP_052790420.1 heat shock 70 kDa protein 12A-like [Mya arenaria]XP_052790421.1 heat shock 70 kDa protein 12A-like [Mya arenaria]
MSLLVASIDFGTTFSGWAYSFKHEYHNNKDNIHTKNWPASSHISQKAPTVVLIKPDGKTLQSFGYEAESKYAELAETGDHKDWYYFRRFKMLLFDEKGVQRNVTIEEVGGKKLNAIDVFYHAIKYIKDDLVQTIKQQLTGEEFQETDIAWVITVPAIWNDAAKQFMRTAAEKAGIGKGKLTLALEPEAASLYCRHLPVNKNVGHSDASLYSFPEGTKYMVLDAGGGTVDITVHEIVSENTVRELHKASGGAWGGIKVDEEFEKLIDELIGPGSVDDLKRESMEEYLDLTQEFEIKKREIDPTSEKQVSIRMPSLFRHFAMIKKRKTLAELVTESKYSGKVGVTRDKFRLDKDISLSLFGSTTESIIDHIQNLLEIPIISDCSAILMVGGFSESRVLQHRIKNAFSQLHIIIPQDAGLAVMKGAVSFGFNPLFIGERIAKYTYGKQDTHLQTEKCSHAPTDLRTHSDGIMCRKLFEVLVEEGSSLKIDTVVETKPSAPIKRGQTSISKKIYASTNPNAKLVTDQGCRKIGKMSFPVDPHLFDRGHIYTTCYKFGGTEIEVRVRNDVTGELYTSTVDFLG